MFKGEKISPIYSLAAAILIGLAMSAMVLQFTQQQPWLGLKLVFDSSAVGAVVKSSQGPSAQIPLGTVITKISSRDDSLTFSELDFVAEPDGGMGTYKTYYGFLDRQDRYARIQRSNEIVFEDTHGGEWKIQPQDRRPLFSLPADFWIQFSVGLSAWLFCASAWALRPRVEGTRYLLLNGFAMLISAQFAAVYTTRELAVPAKLFWWIDGLNFLGGSLFIASLVALLLYYPRKLAPRWVGWAVITIYVVWHILQDNDVVESMTDARRVLVMVGVAATFVLAGIHWRKSRKDPVARASLQWFLLSWILAIGIFSTMLFIPQLAGIDNSSIQGYSFFLFLLMYVGLGFGIMRFRLFGLGEWWYRIVFWILAMLLLVALDLALLFGLHWSNQVSLSTALLVCGLFWLPLRGFLQSRLMPTPKPWAAAFKQVVDIALTPPGSHQTELYIQLLKDFFNPLNIQALKQAPQDAEILEDGLTLLLPSVVGLPGFRLEYAHGGQKLFSPKDVASLKELAGMLQYTVDSQNSYKKGVVEERSRIARDLHDDVGARLLDGLYDSEADLRSTIQGAIGDIRSIVSGISGDQLQLSYFLGDLRHEAHRRLEAVGIEVKWPTIDELPDDRALDYRSYKVIGSAVREIVSNAIKHSKAKSFVAKVDVSSSALTFKFTDDGCGLSDSNLDGSSSGAGDGNGLKILKRRISELNGTLRLQRTSPGTCITMIVPID
jgi:signal transduction histidine kinase